MYFIKKNKNTISKQVSRSADWNTQTINIYYGFGGNVYLVDLGR